VGGGGVAAGVVEDLQVGNGVGAADGGLGLEGVLGVGAVEVGQRDDAGLDLLLQVPGGDGLVVEAGPGGGPVRELLVAGEFAVGAGGVGEDEGVLAVLVLEVVVDPLGLHQAADEVEVGLAVLDAVLPGRVGAGEAGVVEVGEAA